MWLTEDQSAALLAELDRIIENDRYQFSPHIRMLKEIDRIKWETDHGPFREVARQQLDKGGARHCEVSRFRHCNEDAARHRIRIFTRRLADRVRDYPFDRSVLSHIPLARWSV